MTDRQTTGSTDSNFGNAETIPSSARYICNFAGEEINGERYDLGEEIPKPGKPMPDAGTLRYLVQIGRISEKGPGDDAGTSLGGDARVVPTPTPQATITMDRTALLAELADGVADEELRASVERKRAMVAEERREPQAEPQGDEFDAAAFADRNLADITDEALKALEPAQLAEVRAAEVAGRNRPTLIARIDEAAKPPEETEAEGGPLSTEEIAVRDKLVEDNDEAALRAMADGLPGIKSDSDKAEIATAIVMSRRAKD